MVLIVAIKSSEIVLTKPSGSTIVSGVKNNLFPDGRLTDGNVYEECEVHNTNTSLTLSSGKAWLYLDPAGGTFAIALASASAFNSDAAWPYGLDPTTLTYSSPTSQSSGLALPTLAPGQKALIVCRRNLSTGTTATPESNRLYVAGTSPL